MSQEWAWAAREHADSGQGQVAVAFPQFMASLRLLQMASIINQQASMKQ